jgi:NifU-like protein involved in Fe-S cluster formation
MRRIVEVFFVVLGSAIMAASTGYAILFVVGETVEHFTP